MSALAARTGAINLGQGFPDTDGPASLLEDAVAAIRGGVNQYPPGRGIPVLREAIAEHQRRFYGLDVDPETEVLVTAGATEALAAALLALVSPGDEVVVLEPYYDAYAASIELAGATRRTVPLRFPEYTLEPGALAAAVGPRTRLILLNSPHNPTGHVLSEAELAEVARVAREHDLLVLTDEVYEHLVFDGRRHVPLATLPGMAERTLTISSAGKTFSVTGWKIGWIHGPAELVEAVTTVKQFLTYVNGAPFQPAVANALHLPEEHFAETASRMQAGRDLLTEGLVEAGFEVSRPGRDVFRRGRRGTARVRRRHGPVPRPAAPRRRGRRPRPGFPRRPGRRRLSGPVRRLQAAGSPRRGRPAAAVPDPALSSPGGCGP